jgi:hypothetical protein
VIVNTQAGETTADLPEFQTIIPFDTLDTTSSLLGGNHPVFAILVTECFADPIVSLPTDAFRKREAVDLRSTGKIRSPVTIRQPQPR